jgi:hypothetical protein
MSFAYNQIFTADVGGFNYLFDGDYRRVIYGKFLDELLRCERLYSVALGLMFRPGKGRVS